MNYPQFSILSIELSHDQALEFKQLVIDTIENYGYSNFEVPIEIRVPTAEDEPITAYITAQIETLYDGSFTKCDERHIADPISGHKVHRLKIELFNLEGDEVQFEVRGQRYFHDGKYQYATPIDIHEQVIEHIENSLIN